MARAPRTAAPGRHAVLTLLPRAARCPELNSVETVWRFMRGNWFSHRVFLSYDDIAIAIGLQRFGSAMAQTKKPVGDGLVR